MGWKETTQNTLAFAAIALGGATVAGLQAAHSRLPQNPYSLMQWTDWLVYTPGPALAVIGGAAAVALGVYGMTAPVLAPFFPRRHPDPTRAEACTRIATQLSVLRTKDGLPSTPTLESRQRQAIEHVLQSRLWRDMRAREAMLADNAPAGLRWLRSAASRRPWEIERFRDLGVLLAGCDPAAAAEALNFAERVEPGDFWARHVLGRLAQQAGRQDEAEAKARAALDVTENDGERMIALTGLAQTLLAGGDVATAFLLCRQAHDLVRRTRETGQTAGISHDLADAFDAVAAVLASTGRDDQTQSAHEEAAALRRERHEKIPART